MHPLSVFPSLLTYQLLAPTLLRLAVGIYLLFVAKMKVKKMPVEAAIVAILAVFLLLGFYTQVAAVLTIIVLSLDLWRNGKKFGVNLEQKIIFTLIIIILLSLLVTGPGFFALDLPL